MKIPRGRGQIERTEFQNSWKKVLNKIPIEILKQLAAATWEFFKPHEDEWLHTQYAEARCYPRKMCLGFDFKFIKFSIKQAIFMSV